MNKIDRRTALIGAGAATIAAAGNAHRASAQGTPSQAAAQEGIERKVYGDNPSMIPGYKRVQIRDIIVQPGKGFGPSTMNNAMICHMLEGEMEITQNIGSPFVAKKNHVWTCNTGMTEGGANKGTSVAIMRITDLLAT